MRIKIINKRYEKEHNSINIDYALLNKDKQIIYTASVRDNLGDDTKDTINQHFKYNGQSYGEWQDHEIGEE